MKFILDYDFAQVATQQLEIEDISSVCIRISNEANYDWFLNVETNLGTTSIREFGPCLADMNTTLNGFIYRYTEFDYAEPKICSKLEKFIQDPKKEINKITNITTDEFNQILFNQMSIN